MKYKAQRNLEAAQILLNNKQATESVHCSYYAVLQYMKYMLATTDNAPIPYEKQGSAIDNSHQFLITEIQNRIHNVELKRQFNDGIRVLKRERVAADYTSKTFTTDEGLGCKHSADGLITKLKTNFGNI